ncbi:MAG: hypothetical protein Q7T05_00415 [Dehalococcoidia bacterium]|nr:hypothetical protein [Dehalococcoidia bacterium]
MRTVSIELSRRIQELGAWEGRAYDGKDIFFTRHWIDEAWTDTFAPTLAHLLDALAATGQTHIWKWDKLALPRTGWHCEVGIKAADSIPRFTHLVWWPGNGATSEDAAAACLIAVLEAERALRPCTACGDECPIEEVEP